MEEAIGQSLSIWTALLRVKMLGDGVASF